MRLHICDRRILSRRCGQSPQLTVILSAESLIFGDPVEKSKLVIVVHYHEVWLKGGNRRFFLSKLHLALKRALEGLPVERILRPGDRMLMEFGEGASAEEAVARIERVFGVAFYAVARVVPRERRRRYCRAGPRGVGRNSRREIFDRLPCVPSAATNRFRTARSTSKCGADNIWPTSCAPRAAMFASSSTIPN